MAEPLFSHFFPVPGVLAMEGGGIEISDRSVKYLLLKFRDTQPEIASYGQVLLPAGAVVGGDIVDAGVVAGALGEVRERAGFTFVHASLPDKKGYLFDLVAPRRSAASLSEDVALALSKQVPLSPAEMVFDCETIFTESTGTARSVVVAAFPESLAHSYVKVFNDAGFSVLSFELESEASTRALFPPGAVPDGAQLCIDFGSEKSILSIVQNGVVRFATTAEGGAALDTALRERIAALRGMPRDSEETEQEILRIKSQEGLMPENASAEIFVGSMTALVAEVNRILVYWNSRSAKGESRGKVASIVLYGGNAAILGLMDYLSRVTGIPVHCADIGPALGAGNAKFAIPKDQSIRYVTTLGLALRGDRTSPW